MDTKIKQTDRLLILLLVIGFAVRLFGLGNIPFGSAPEESRFGYEAFSLVNYGSASNGSRNPVMLDAAGYPESPLYSWLSMLPVKLFGLSLFSMRITMALLGCLSLLIFYLFIKNIAPQQTAFLSLFLLAINPWNIMMSRWGFAAHAVCFFGLAGSFFLHKGIKRPVFLIVAAVFFGLGFYAFPIAWISFPFIVLFFGAYCLYTRKIEISKPLLLHASIAGALLVLLGLPNILYLLVQSGAIGEIRTNFITIPRPLDVNTAKSVFSSNIIKNLLSDMKYYIFDQSCWTLRPQGFGIFYFFSTPLMLFGFIKLMAEFIKRLKVREFYEPAVPLFQLFGAVFVILFTRPGVSYHQSLLFIPAIYCGAHGVSALWEKLGNICGKTIIALYALAFVIFIQAYWTQPPYTERFSGGYELAVAKAETSAAAKIYVVNIPHPNFLVAAKYPTDKLIGDAEYVTIESAVKDVKHYTVKASRIGRYYFPLGDEMSLEATAAYIYPVSMGHVTQALNQNGFQAEQLGPYIFAEKK